MIKPLYKSFVPYIALLVVILIAVYILDNYAEKISRQPEVIQLNEENYESEQSDLTWQLENEIAPEHAAGEARDSLYRDAMRLFKQRDFQRAEEVMILMLNQAPGSPAAWNLRGIIAIQQLEHKEAESYFLKALERDPAYTEARTNLASLYMTIHRYRDAEHHYQLARSASPFDPEICANLGLLYVAMEMSEPALEAFAKAAELSSGKRKAGMLMQLGTVQLEVEDTLASRETLNEAILLDPGNEQARLQLALTYRNAGKREEELLKIYRLNPGSFDANYQLGKLYRDQENYSRAEFHFQKALEKRAYHEKTMSELGTMLIEQNRMDEAELVFSGFAAGDTLPQSYFYQAKIAAGKGMADEAIRLYQLAIEKSLDDYPEAYLNLAILHKQNTELHEAIRCYKEAIKARPDYSLAYYNLALLYTEVDSLERTIDCYKESIRADPGAIKSWYNLGRIYDKLENTPAAKDAYRHAVQINPEYTKALLALGNSCMRSEDLEEAVEWYRDLLDRYPNYSKAWFNLGLAYSRLEQTGKAEQAYETLIEVDPGNVRGRINLAILYGRDQRVDLAIAVLEDAMDLDTDNPDIRFNLALQHKKLDQLKSATSQFLHVVELDPQYRQAYQELMEIFSDLEDDLNYEITYFRYLKAFEIEGDFYETGKRLHELERPGLALEAYTLARAAGDDQVWLDYWTGKAYMDMGEMDEAIDWFEVTLERDLEHKFSLYRLGQIYEMLGDPGEAETYYDRLLALDRDFKIVHKSALQSNP